MTNQKIYVANIPVSYDKDTIEQLFSAYGKITEINYPLDKKTRQPKGYAFICFDKPASAQRALEKNAEELDGKNLIVEIAIEKTTRRKVKEETNNDE